MKIAVLDIDGVLADDRHRLQFARNKQWALYFAPEKVSQDAVWLQGYDLAWSLVEQEYFIFYLTGRSEDIREATWRWLQTNGFPAGPLLMRPPYDSRNKNRPALAEFKRDTLRDLTHRDPFVLYDDDPEVIRVIREEFGEQAAVHCTWHVKDDFMVKTAKS